MKNFLSILILSLILISWVSAHGGRLNSEWCHNDYDEGTYHCHDDDGNIVSSINIQEKEEMITEKKAEMLENKEEREEYRETITGLRDEARELRAERKVARQEFISAARKISSQE